MIRLSAAILASLLATLSALPALSAAAQLEYSTPYAGITKTGEGPQVAAALENSAPVSGQIRKQSRWQIVEPSENRRQTPDAVRMVVEEVTVTPSRLQGLELTESLRLSAEHRHFGGFSGLLVEDGVITAVSDVGWLLTTTFEHVFGNGAAELQRLPGTSGSGSKKTSDAESLARFKDGFAIGFERDHRIEFIKGGQPVQVLRHPRFKRMGRNEGLEALATLPGDRLLAISEKPVSGAFPVFVIHSDGQVDEGTFPKNGRHAITGADFGPGERLYLLRRDWSLLGGISARIERYQLDEFGFPRAESRELLAVFDTASGIDNMEGIAVWEEEGRIRLAILSDDNFNPFQRTLLLLFDVTE